MHWLRTEENQIINLEQVRTFYLYRYSDKEFCILCSLVAASVNGNTEFAIKYFDKKEDATEWLNKLWLKLYDTHQYDPTATEV